MEPVVNYPYITADSQGRDGVGEELPLTYFAMGHSPGDSLGTILTQTSMARALALISYLPDVCQPETAALSAGFRRSPLVTTPRVAKMTLLLAKGFI